jgi:hypothetical protein
LTVLLKIFSPSLDGRDKGRVISFSFPPLPNPLPQGKREFRGIVINDVSLDVGLLTNIHIFVGENTNEEQINLLKIFINYQSA